MKRMFWMVVCLALVVGCQPTDSTGVDGVDGDSGNSNATDAAMLESDGALMNVSVVKFEVPGMSCPEGCAPVVKSTLESQPGVEACEIQFESKIATCKVTKDFDAEKALTALQSNTQFADSKLAN